MFGGSLGSCHFLAGWTCLSRDVTAVRRRTGLDWREVPLRRTLLVYCLFVALALTYDVCYASSWYAMALSVLVSLFR